jgi:hypothetical protein
MLPHRIRRGRTARRNHAAKIFFKKCTPHPAVARPPSPARGEGSLVEHDQIIGEAERGEPQRCFDLTQSL